MPTGESWLQALQTLLVADESHLPWTFATDWMPYPDAFTFGGADLEGQFLEHLTTVTSTKSSKA